MRKVDIHFIEIESHVECLKDDGHTDEEIIKKVYDMLQRYKK